MSQDTESEMASSMGSTSDMVEPTPLIFHDVILEADEMSSPEASTRVITGTSINEPDAVLEEDGRTYHGYKGGRYFLPNDPDEQDRLDFQHAMCKLMFDERLICAPIASPSRILDIATGTGIWAIEYATENPDATIIGTDLSLISPPNAVPNFTVVKEDSEEDEWGSAEDGPFDYVHLRFVFLCFQDPMRVLRKAFEHLRPGGWVEYQDPSARLHCVDGSIAGTALERYWELVLEGGRAAGRDFLVAEKYKAMLEEAGFVDIVEEREPRLKAVGMFQAKNMFDVCRGLAWKLFRPLGLEVPEIEDLVAQTKLDIHNKQHHCYHWVYVVYGRKPFPDEVAVFVSKRS
ncbi:hypothetical protein PG984_007628 [Apiospora sp. TS-2023a]